MGEHTPDTVVGVALSVMNYKERRLRLDDPDAAVRDFRTFTGCRIRSRRRGSGRRASCRQFRVAHGPERSRRRAEGSDGDVPDRLGGDFASARSVFESGVQPAGRSCTMYREENGNEHRDDRAGEDVKSPRTQSAVPAIAGTEGSPVPLNEARAPLSCSRFRARRR